MSETAQLHDLTIERVWLDGLKAIDEQYEEADGSRRRWVRIGNGMLAGRKLCPAKQDFGDWLDTTGYRVVTRHDRPDAIWLATNAEIALPALSETRIGNPERARRYIRECLPLLYEHCKEVSMSDMSDNDTQSLSLAQPTPASAPMLEIATSPDVKAQRAKVLDKRSGFYDAPRAEELARLFQSKGARDTLSRMWRERGGKQAWNLIVTALDAGLIVPNDAWPKEPTLLLLFPLAPVGIARQYDLMNHKQRSQIRDVLLPAMIACRDELLAEPHRLREILADHERGRQAKKHESIIAEKRSAALTSLAPNQQELVMFGHTVWPRLDLNQGDYDYDQVRAAIWTFRDYEAWNQMAKEDVGSFVRRVRNSLRYLGEYLDRTERSNRMNRIFSLVVWFSHLMETNPNGECKWPHYPHIEGQW